MSIIQICNNNVLKPSITWIRMVAWPIDADRRRRVSRLSVIWVSRGTRRLAAGSATSSRRTSPTGSDGPSSYPTQPAAQRKNQYVSDSDSEYGRHCRRRRRSPPVTRIKHGVLHVHKDYEGRFPLCYYATGLPEGGQHDGHARSIGCCRHFFPKTYFKTL